jgi:hypothetical protein
MRRPPCLFPSYLPHSDFKKDAVDTPKDNLGRQRLAAFFLGTALMPPKKRDENDHGGKGAEQKPSSPFPSARNICVHSAIPPYCSLPEPAESSVTRVTR